MSDKGTVLVAGATGVVGGMVARDLLARGEKVRVLTREGSDVAELEQAGAEIARGDLKRALSIRQAMDGVTRVVSTATASARGGEDTIETVDRVGGLALIDAAREAGVERFVYVSFMGASADSPLAIGRAKAENEARLEENGVHYTILRPVAFMDAWIGWVVGSQVQNGDTVKVVGPDEKPFGFVAARNVADLAVAVLRDPRAANQAIPLCAGVASYRQIVKRIAKATGRKLEIETVEPGEELTGFPPIIGELWALLGRVPEWQVTDDVHETYGIRPITVEQFIDGMFGGEQ